MAIPASESELFESLYDLFNEKFDQLIEKIADLDERVDELRKNIDQDLKLNYLNSVARFLEKEALELMGTMTCSYHLRTEVQCKSWVSSNISGYLENLSIGNLAGAQVMLKQFLQEIQKNMNNLDNNAHCRKEWKYLYETLSHHQEFIREISSLFVPQAVISNLQDASFDPDFVSESFLVPLAHPLRVKIIYSLKESSKRFTAMKEELDIKNTGLLVHHLKPLTDAGFVTQNYKKEYLLTEKGYMVAKFLSQLDASLRPENTVSIEKVKIGIDNVDWKELKVIHD